MTTEVRVIRFLRPRIRAHARLAGPIAPAVLLFAMMDIARTMETARLLITMHTIARALYTILVMSART